MDELDRPYHPIADLFPLLQDEEFEQLKADIAANGLLEAIWLHPDGSIIDGRNRHRACIETGTRPRFQTWNGQGSLVSFVVSLNLHRRHLTSSQRSVVALDVEAELAKEGRENMRRGGEGSEKIPNPIRAAEQAAELLQTNSHYIRDAKRIQQEAPDLLEQVRDGKLAIPQAKKELKRREQAQERKDARPEPGTYEAEIGTIVIGDARAMDLSAFKDAPFGVIIADPPWPYRVERGEGIASDQYDTMTDADLQAMPVAQLAKPDSILFLWGTWPKLPEVLQVMRAWGFEYVTGFPWVKTTTNNLKSTPVQDVTLSYGVGYWVRGCSEYVLIGRRGKVSAPRLDGFLGILSPNLQHSRKPEDVHVIAQKLPGPYLELFGRRAHPGFTVFGNEVQGAF